MEKFKTPSWRDSSFLDWLFGLSINIRFYVVFSSAALAALVYFLATAGGLYGTEISAALSRIYGLLSVLYLYLAVLITPLYKRFPKLIGQLEVQFARRGIGVSAFGFALLHGSITLFVQLGGIGQLTHLQGNYFYSVMFGFGALGILFAMAAISFDIAIQRMGFRLWKSVQRFVYIALVLTIAHLVTSNTEYNSLGGFIPAISLLGLIFLLYLETRRIIVNRHASMARVKQS